jgi:uncharacterized membrane protein YgaE (UPF0421/DUF939 family)
MIARNATGRVRAAGQPLVLAMAAAALAWLIAHRVLGHPAPFFAPIAAAISLSTSRIQRSRRIVQMVVGVLLGIVIAEVLAAVIGTSTAALAVTVLVTMAVAVAVGAGFVGEGMMFANQAAASAILVVTLHRHGTGSERAIDAIVGGVVAFIIGVVLFPAEPLSLLGEAERTVLLTLARTLRRAALSGEQPEEVELAMLDAGSEIHDQIAALSRARSTARANVRIAPRRWRLRSLVTAETQRTLRLHLLSSAVLGLIRAVAEGAYPRPEGFEDEVAALADTLERLGSTRQPWPEGVTDEVRATAARLRAYAEAHPSLTGAMILGATGHDLELLLSDD